MNDIYISYNLKENRIKFVLFGTKFYKLNVWLSNSEYESTTKQIRPTTLGIKTVLSNQPILLPELGSKLTNAMNIISSH